MTLPVAGGGYFRLLPLAVTRWAIRRVNAEGLPFMFYLHPWEVDPDQPRIRVGIKSRLRHYTNLSASAPRLAALLEEFQMGPVWEVLKAQGSTEAVTQVEARALRADPLGTAL